MTHRAEPPPRSRPLPLLAVLALTVAAIMAAACGSAAPGTGGSGGGDGAATSPRDPAGDGAGPPARSNGARQPLYVAVGASESVGIGAEDPLSQAWPQVLFRTGMPRETVFVNLGVPGSTVAEALTQQAPEAVRLAPALVTVWLNVNDLLSGVSPADYQRRLATLVHRLRRGGATKVLVANTPPLDRLPALRACVPGARAQGPCRLPEGRRPPDPSRLDDLVAAYNKAIAAVASREGATLVDLHAAGLAARAAGTEASFVAPDGFHPSTAGHAAVAGVFASALRDTGGI